jgi:hypothetical protein
MDMEYLKNLIMQLYTTGEAEVLLPVFTRLLSLGPEDVKRCRQVHWGGGEGCLTGPALCCPALPAEGYQALQTSNGRGRLLLCALPQLALPVEQPPQQLAAVC